MQNFFSANSANYCAGVWMNPPLLFIIIRFRQQLCHSPSVCEAAEERRELRGGSCWNFYRPCHRSFIVVRTNWRGPATLALSFFFPPADPTFLHFTALPTPR